MLKCLLFVLVVLQLLESSLGSVGDKCYHIFQNNIFYSLDKLQSTTDYNYTLDDNSTLYYNFCGFAVKKCSDSSRKSYAIIVSSDNETCVRLTNDQLFSGYTFQMMDEDTPSKGVYLVITGGDAMTTELNYELEIDINCDSSYSSLSVKNVTQVSNRIIIDTISKYGCPTLELSRIWSFLSEQKIILSIIMVSIGFLECFFGLKMLKPTLFIMGYATGFGVLIAIFGEFILKPDTNMLMVWVILIISLLFGTLLGYVTSTIPRVGFFLAGFWLGAIIAFLMNNVLLYKISSNSSSSVPLWIAIILFGTLCGLASCVFWRVLVIVATSFVGSYFMIRPFGWVAGHYPNEFTIAKQIKMGELQSIPNEFYLYFTLILVVAFVGIKFQYSRYKKQKKLDEENNNDELFSQELDEDEENNGENEENSKNNEDEDNQEGEGEEEGEGGEQKQQGSDENEEEQNANKSEEETGNKKKQKGKKTGKTKGKKNETELAGEQELELPEQNASLKNSKISAQNNKGKKSKKQKEHQSDDEDELKNFDQIEGNDNTNNKKKKTSQMQVMNDDNQDNTEALLDNDNIEDVEKANQKKKKKKSQIG